MLSDEAPSGNMSEVQFFTQWSEVVIQLGAGITCIFTQTPALIITFDYNKYYILLDVMRTASGCVIRASLWFCTLHSRLSFSSFAFTKLIGSWHKVSHCCGAGQSASNTFSPLPCLYRPVTSHWTEWGTNNSFLSSTVVRLKWPTRSCQSASCSNFCKCS